MADEDPIQAALNKGRRSGETRAATMAEAEAQAEAAGGVEARRAVAEALGQEVDVPPKQELH